MLSQGGDYLAGKHIPPIGRCRGTPTFNGTKLLHPYPYKILANIHTLTGTKSIKNDAQMLVLANSTEVLLF